MALTGYTIAQDRPREMTPEQREREIHELEVRLDQLRSQARRDRPERGPRMPHPGMMHARMEMTERLVEMNSEPGQAGLLAIGALAREIPLEPARRIEVLEATLEATESLPLRNALRFALKDLYLRTEQVDKAVGVMRDLLAENDEVLADYIARDCDEDDDEADDEDEEDDDEAGDEHRE
jgi:hypothetical protein